MKLITRDTDYAVRALVYMAQIDEDRATVTDMVAKLKIPRPFLRKILQILSNEGILTSFKGKNGGFTLAAPPHKILLSDIINIFNGPIVMNDCLFKKEVCPDRSRCIMRKEIQDIEKYAQSKLNSISIKYLIGT